MNINVNRFILGVLAVFVFLFLFEYIVNDILLMPTYQETPHVWRNLDEMQANMPLSMLFQLSLAVWATYIFVRLFPDGGLNNGLRLGLYLGVFAGIICASWYLWLPVGTKLGWSWLASGIVEGLGSGFLLGSIYHK